MGFDRCVHLRDLMVIDRFHIAGELTKRIDERTMPSTVAEVPVHLVFAMSRCWASIREEHRVGTHPDAWRTDPALSIVVFDYKFLDLVSALEYRLFGPETPLCSEQLLKLGLQFCFLNLRA